MYPTELLIISLASVGSVVLIYMCTTTCLIHYNSYKIQKDLNEKAKNYLTI
jgi:hypothetical protein